MSTVAPEVEAYLAAVPAEHRGAIEALRRTIREVVPDADEVITYGIPTFKQKRSIVAFGDFKNHYSFFPMSSELVERHAAELAGYSISKGTIRIPLDRPLPADLIRTLVRERLAQNEARDQKQSRSTRRRNDMTQNNAPATEMHREVTLTRVFDAPRELVFRVWTEAEHLQRWWGPHHFTNPVCEIDARPNGAILIHMQGPDGITYPMTGTIDEIVPPERFVFTSQARDPEGNALLEARTTVTFEDEGGKTRLTVHASAVGLVPIAAQMLAGMEVGWSQSLERLGELLAQLS